MFCSNCGAQLPEIAAFCTACGVNTNRNDQYKSNHFTNMQNNPVNDIQVRISPKSRRKAIILCVLCFFGFGGIHRFYTGKVVSGIIHFFTFGLFFIGCIIDLVALSKGAFKDSKGFVLAKDNNKKADPNVYITTPSAESSTQPASYNNSRRGNGKRIIKPIAIILVIIAVLTGTFFLFGYKPYQYSKAIKIFDNAIYTSEYENAAEIFKKLGEYKDSEHYLYNTNEILLYKYAETMVDIHIELCEMWLGKYDANAIQFDMAWAAYGDLLEYAEKDLRHFEVYQKGLENISYLLAEYCFEDEQYNKAIIFYELAHDFEDAEEKLEMCRQEIVK